MKKIFMKFEYLNLLFIFIGNMSQYGGAPYHIKQPDSKKPS